MSVVQDLAKLRKVKGISQSELAKRIGTTQARLAEIEAGKRIPSIKRVETMAHALDATVVVHSAPQ